MDQIKLCLFMLVSYTADYYVLLCMILNWLKEFSIAFIVYFCMWLFSKLSHIVKFDDGSTERNLLMNK